MGALSGLKTLLILPRNARRRDTRHSALIERARRFQFAAHNGDRSSSARCLLSNQSERSIQSIVYCGFALLFPFLPASRIA